MDKSPDAFRTISEVADWLGTPTHVLRFWESRFTQVKPVKRAGGRRYYRPADMELLGGIKKLLHDDGMTIRGVQKLLREEGAKHVAALSQSLDIDAAPGSQGDAAIDASALPDHSEDAPAAPMVTDAPQDDPDNVVPLSRTLAETEQRRASAAARQPEVRTPDPVAPLREGRQRDLLDDVPAAPEADETTGSENADAEAEEADAEAAVEPAEKSAAEPVAAEPAEVAKESAPVAEAPVAPVARPAAVSVPPDLADDDATLPHITGVAELLRRTQSRPQAERPTVTDLGPLYKRLVALRDRMPTK